MCCLLCFWGVSDISPRFLSTRCLQKSTLKINMDPEQSGVGALMSSWIFVFGDLKTWPSLSPQESHPRPHEAPASQPYACLRYLRRSLADLNSWLKRSCGLTQRNSEEKNSLVEDPSSLVQWQWPAPLAQEDPGVSSDSTGPSDSTGEVGSCSKRCQQEVPWSGFHDGEKMLMLFYLTI